MSDDPQFELLKGVGDGKQKVLDLWDETDATLPRHERLRAFAVQADVKAQVHGVIREGDISEAMRIARDNALELSNNILLMEEACSAKHS